MRLEDVTTYPYPEHELGYLRDAIISPREFKQRGKLYPPKQSFGKCECEKVMQTLTMIAWMKNEWVGASCRDLDDFIEPSDRIRDHIRKMLPRELGLKGRLPELPIDGEPMQVSSGFFGRMRNESFIGSFSVFTVVGIRMLVERKAIIVRSAREEDVIFPAPSFLSDLSKEARRDTTFNRA